MQALPPGRADLLLAGAFLVETQVELSFLDASRGTVLAARGLALAMALGVAARRRAPLVAAALVFAALTGMEQLGDATNTSVVGPYLSAFIVSYSIGANLEGRALAVGVGWLVLLVSALSLLDPSADQGLNLLWGRLVIVAAPVLAGRLLRDRARLARELRAAAADHDPEPWAEQAVADERSRIAADLHGVVARALGRMVVDADGAAGLVDSEPGRAARPSPASRCAPAFHSTAGPSMHERGYPLSPVAEEPPDMTVRILIADDQALVRAGFKMILDAEDDLDVVGEASDGAQAVAMANDLEPDVVLMDIRMPELDGIEATRRIIAAAGERPVRVLMLTTFDLNEYVYEALRAGASGFLLKDVPPEQLVAGIRVVAEGEALLAPSITRRLIQEFASAAPTPAEPPRGLDELTARELEVFKLLARGLSNAEIAEELVVSETTVKTHVARVLMKLGLRDRVQAVVLAYESGVAVPGRSG